MNIRQRPFQASDRGVSLRWPHAFALLLFLALLMFWDVVFSPGNKVLSAPHTDIATQFLYWRDFGFSELREGRLALWNPHLFSGAPYFGGFQSALLYPLNALYLFLPLGIAVNAGIVLHVFLLGFFTYLWAAQKGLHPLASLLTGILIMFCGPHFLHIFAGHLPNLCAMTWVPLIFLALDGLLKRPTLGGGLLGGVAFAMHILAGHPQYVYYTCLAACAYMLAASFPLIRERKLLSILAILATAAAGFALSAVQILPGIDAAGESVRAGGVSLSFAAMFSLPPENLLTLLTPYFFGDLMQAPYWGRAYLWEMNLFMSINGLTLAVYGTIAGGKPARRLFATAMILLVLALGAHTPLFQLLFDYMPGYDKFRGTSKFIFYADLFLILLGGMGLDALLNHIARPASSETPDSGQARRQWLSLDRFYLFILLSALVAAGCALALRSASQDASGMTALWSSFIQHIAASGESYLNRTLFSQDIFIHKTASMASVHVLITSVILALSAGLWSLSLRRRTIAAYGLFVFAVLEVFLFARSTLVSFDIRYAGLSALRQFTSSMPTDARRLNLWRPNSAMGLKAFDLWGYDPGVPKRYAELIAFTQKQDPSTASQYIHFHRYHPLLKMLRLRYILVPEKEGLKIYEFPGEMSRLELVGNWRVMPAASILEEMAKPAFDPRKVVLVETPPGLPDSGCAKTGSARIVSSSTDAMTIEANLACPQILLITDNYADGWRIEASPPSEEKRYKILRANYTLMAVPLEAGNHSFRVFYRPTAFIAGAAISGTAWLLYALTALVWLKRMAAKSRPSPPPPASGS